MTIPKDEIMQRLEILWLEYPPTNNQLHTNVYMKGRVISGKYRAWQDNYPPMGLVKPKSPITEPFKMTYHIIKHKDKRRRDLANYEKALTDSLVKHGIVKDDSQMICLRMEWITLPADWRVRGIIEWTESD